MPSSWLGIRTVPNRIHSPITMLPAMRNGAKKGMLTWAAAITVSLFKRRAHAANKQMPVWMPYRGTTPRKTPTNTAAAKRRGSLLSDRRWAHSARSRSRIGDG